MKTIGIIGGMSWESSVVYYRLINEGIKKSLGGVHSAKSVMVSVDFAEIEVLQKSGDWKTATEMMITAAKQVEAGGADFLVIATNTMHLMAEDVQRSIIIPILHIADPTAEAVKKAGIQKIGLLGTRFTMDRDFYKGRLSSKHGLDVVTPDDEDKKVIHDVIYNELVIGRITDSSRKAYLDIIKRMAQSGAQGIILGCTEIGLLVKQADCELPLFDTTILHALAAVEFALR